MKIIRENRKVRHLVKQGQPHLLLARMRSGVDMNVMELMSGIRIFFVDAKPKDTFLKRWVVADKGVFRQTTVEESFVVVGVFSLEDGIEFEHKEAGEKRVSAPPPLAAEQLNPGVRCAVPGEWSLPLSDFT